MKPSDWLIVLLVGVLILILAIPSKQPTTWESAETEQNEESQTAVETELEELLSHMQGVGKVKVMITTAKQDESIFADKTDNEIEGVVVLAEGADNITTVSNISSVIMALFDIDAHRIKIVKMSESEDGR